MVEKHQFLFIRIAFQESASNFNIFVFEEAVVAIPPSQAIVPVI